MVGTDDDLSLDFWVVDCGVGDCVCWAEVEVLKGSFCCSLIPLILQVLLFSPAFLSYMSTWALWFSGEESRSSFSRLLFSPR